VRIEDGRSDGRRGATHFRGGSDISRTATAGLDLQLVQVDVAYKLSGDAVDASFSLERYIRDPSAFVTSETAVIANNQAQALQAAQQAAQNQSSGQN
jgi:hypothetical protein